MAEQGGGHHGHVRPGEDHLDHVVGTVDTGGGGERCIHPAVEDGYPAEHQPQLRRRGEHQVGRHLEPVEVDVGLIEPVEEDEPVSAGVGEPTRHVRHRREEGPDLDRQRHRHGLPHLLDEPQILELHLGPA